MKQLLCVVFLGILAAGCNKAQERRMTVVRDCTGTYLQLDHKDYQVCNTMATNDYPTGARVKATIKAISSCSEAPAVVCELYHPSEGWIKVVHIEVEE